MISSCPRSLWNASPIRRMLRARTTAQDNGRERVDMRRLRRRARAVRAREGGGSSLAIPKTDPRGRRWGRLGYSMFRCAATATAWARVSTPSLLKIEVR
jgi:hypothetical protein